MRIYECILGICFWVFPNKFHNFGGLQYYNHVNQLGNTTIIRSIAWPILDTLHLFFLLITMSLCIFDKDNGQHMKQAHQVCLYNMNQASNPASNRNIHLVYFLGGSLGVLPHLPGGLQILTKVHLSFFLPSCLPAFLPSFLPAFLHPSHVCSGPRLVSRARM